VEIYVPFVDVTSAPNTAAQTQLGVLDRSAQKPVAEGFALIG